MKAITLGITLVLLTTFTTLGYETMHSVSSLEKSIAIQNSEMAL